MIEPRLASILGLAPLALGLVAGCGSTPLMSAGNQREPFDGALPQSDGPPAPVDGMASPPDAGDCQCLLGTDHILRMSWACFCANYNECLSDEATFCDSNVGWASGCGLDTHTVYTLDGIEEWVFDHQSGAVVGIQDVNGDGLYTCPTDANLQSNVVVAGTFPDATCARSAACGCTGAGPPCPAPDGGLFPHP
jgi:hypothetical protein